MCTSLQLYFLLLCRWTSVHMWGCFRTPYIVGKRLALLKLYVDALIDAERQGWDCRHRCSMHLNMGKEGWLYHLQIQNNSFLNSSVMHGKPLRFFNCFALLNCTSALWLMRNAGNPSQGWECRHRCASGKQLSVTYSKGYTDVSIHPIALSQQAS